MWPTVEVFEAAAPRAPRDLVLVQGIEPSLRWRGFCAHIVDLAEALGVQVVVSLGALLGDVPHTRPVSISGHASDPLLMERLGMQGLDVRGPDGDRRRAAQRVRPGRAALGEPVGRGSPLRRGSRAIQRRRWRWCAASKA